MLMDSNLTAPNVLLFPFLKRGILRNVSLLYYFILLFPKCHALWKPDFLISHTYIFKNIPQKTFKSIELY